MVITMEILLNTIGLTILLLAILLFSIWYFIRKKYTHIRPYLYILSVLAMSLSCLQLLSISNFNPALQTFLVHSLTLLWILFYTTLFILALVLVGFYILTPNYMNASADVQTVFYSIQDLALISNRNGDIVEINHPNQFVKTFDSITSLTALLDAVHMDTLPETDCEITYKGLSYYLNIIPIVSHRFFVGHALIFYDITALKSIETALGHQKKVLEDAYEKLQQEANLASSLNTENLRLQQIQRIQDTLAKDIASALEELDLILGSTYDQVELYHQDVTDFSNTLRCIYSKVRTFVHKIFTNQGENT